MADTPFKLFDDDGGLLVVRRDNTLPIVWLVSARMAPPSLPCACAMRRRWFARQRALPVGSRQFTQLGYELIGEGSKQVDTKDRGPRALIAQSAWFGRLAHRVRQRSSFQRVLALANDAALSRDALKLVHANNFIDLDDRVAASGVSPCVARAMCEIPRIHGGLDALDRVDELLADAGADECATTELLRALQGLAVEAEDGDVLAERVTFDFSLINSLITTPGSVFKVYARRPADPVGSRSLRLRARRGVWGRRRVPAAGFAFSLERLEGATGSARAADGD